MLREIHPKEFEMIEISEERWRELREQLSPDRRKKLDEDRLFVARSVIADFSKNQPELIDLMLSDLPPEQRLASLPPEQRLAGLNEQERQELLKLLTESIPTKPTEAEAAADKDSEPS
jgi:hypothetical protein